MNEIAGTGARSAAIPSAYVDRGSLSEAWYRALYGTREPSRTDATARASENGARSAASPEHAVAVARSTYAASGRLSIVRASLGARTIAIVRADRQRPDRTIRVPSAVRAVPKETAKRTTFMLTLPDGRNVDLLVLRRGRRVHVVALADRGSSGHVASALQRARIALSAHGLRLDVDAREKGTS